MQGSNDSQVQRTNDDAVLSKRSANKVGYFEDDFLRHFAGKLVRRAPLINKGYYLRAVCMRHVLTWFTESRAGPIQIVGLGCGFDTTAYRLVPSVAARTHFFEVDYEEVLRRKKELIHAAGPIVYSPPGRHHIIGCDIRETAALKSLLQAHDFDSNTPTLFLSECVLQYIPAGASEAVVTSMRGLMGPTADAVFAIFDQMTPSDTFGDIMMKSLRARSSPLLGIETFGTIVQQENRFQIAGWENVKCVMLVDVDDTLLRSRYEERSRIASLEPHDEHEDWTETCRHYCLSMGATKKECDFPFQRPPATTPIVAYPIATRTVTATPLPRTMKLKGYGHSSVILRDGAAAKVLTFGGHVNEARSADVYLYDLVSEVESKVESTGTIPSARVHHAMASLGDNTFLLFGGRTSPDAALGDTYVLDGLRMHWTQRTSPGGPCARFRHSLASAGGGRIALFGGRTGHRGTCLQDVWIFTQENGWNELKTNGVAPSPRHSFGFCYLETKGSLLVSGGLTDEGHPLGDMYLLDMTTSTWTNLVLPTPAPALFSHTLTYIPAVDEVLILGGIHESLKYTDINTNVLLLNVATFAISQITTISSLSTTCKHQAVLLPDGATVALLGGGFQCFSFGTFLQKGLVLNLSPKNDFSRAAEAAGPVEVAEVPGDTTLSAWENQLYLARRPVVLRGINLGPCVTLWKDAEYLIEKEGTNLVSVHIPDEKESRQLDFVRRNFTYQTVPFKDLVEACFIEAKQTPMYFRSIARQRGLADLWANFPGIGPDFVVPKIFQTTTMASSKYSQSCLRMNGKGVQLWTHYDIMDNILCQITGEKRVVLYPPSEYGNLYVEGSTSRVIDIDKPDYARYPKFRLAQTKSMELTLYPGDVLFIPAMWFHNVTATTASISVNIFWKHLDDALYDPKDTYGNKDLPCMVIARQRLMKEIPDLVKDVPPEYRSFVLRQVFDDVEKTLH